MVSEIREVESHIDYLTLTIPFLAPVASRAEFASSAKSSLYDHGNIGKWRDARLRDYAGTRCGSAFAGARKDGSILQVSGSLAHVAALREWPREAKVTRIDLAVTVYYSEDLPWVAKVTADDAEEARKRPGRKPFRKLVLYDGKGDGDTCYIGSRASEEVSRVYDKYRQSGEELFFGAWRWEVEYKGSRAVQIWKGLKNSSDKARAITATVQTFFDERGIDCSPRVGNRGALYTCVTRREGDDLRRLEWLAKQVRPTVRELICNLGEEMVYSALGIEGSAEYCTEDSSLHGGV